MSVVVALCAVSTAWACVPGGGGGSKLTIEPKLVRPGGEVTVTLPPSSTSATIEVRLDGSDGPLLGTVSPGRGPGGSSSANFTVPIDTEPGQVAVIAVQQGAKWDPVVLGVAGPDGIVPRSARGAARATPRTGGLGRNGLLVTAVGIGAATLGAGSVLQARRRRVTSTSPGVS